MNTRAVRGAVLALVMMSAPVAAGAAEVTLISSNAVKTVIEELGPRFEQASGHKLVLVFSTAGDLNKRVADGEAADLLISTATGVDGLINSGKLVGPRIDVVRFGVGVGVKAGAPKPDISTPEALKKALLAARAVAYTDPASGGSSGIHFAKVLEQLGIAAEVNRNAKLGNNVLAGTFVVNGEADIAIQQIPELKLVAGIDVVGPLPAGLQATTTLAAAVPANARQADAARALVELLRSKDAMAVFEEKGMEAPQPSK
jgi:molybdate transport system substrate-binding protein